MDRKRAAHAGTSVFALGLVLLLLPTRADAYLIGSTPHELDPTEQVLDHTPPGAVGVLEVLIRRGHGNEQAGCDQWVWTEDQGVGNVAIRLTPPVDDRTPPESMGYRVELLSGQAPEGLVPDFDVRAYLGGDGTWLYLHWFDGETNEQEPLDFVLQIRAVDLGGNVGETARSIVVGDPGSGGCATGAFHATGPTVLLTLCFGVLAWRRRSRALS